MDMYSSMLSSHWNWPKLFSYGEVVCFISAWAVGLIVAMQGGRQEHNRVARHNISIASDSLGIQATRSR
jgi:hypothetical protein